MSPEKKDALKEKKRLQKQKERAKLKEKAKLDQQALIEQQAAEATEAAMRTLPIIDKRTCKILKLRGAYQPDHEIPPGIQEKIDHNLLKLAGEIIVRKTMDRENEPGGI